MCRWAIRFSKSCCSKPAWKPCRPARSSAIQDMGAAGLTCSTCEMGSRGGTGIEIDLDRVPQRETGMTPYEIMLSESQERMLLVAEKGREDEVFRGVPQVGAGCRHHRHGDRRRQAARAASRRRWSPRFPIASWPMKRRSTTGRTTSSRIAARRSTAPDAPPANDLAAAILLQLLASPDLCSKRWIWEQYDYMVRTNTIAGPGCRRGRRAHQRNRHVDRDVARWQRPLLLSSTARRREAGGGRMLPQSGDRGRACRWRRPII